MRAKVYRIAKRFRFSASHELRSLPKTHQCSRNHGHNYEVELILHDQRLDAHGFVDDYGNLGVFGDYLRRTFDHRLLNDLMSDEPTAEHLAALLYEEASGMWGPLVECVRVSETPDTWAEYRP